MNIVTRYTLITTRELKECIIEVEREYGSVLDRLARSTDKQVTLEKLQLKPSRKLH